MANAGSKARERDRAALIGKRVAREMFFAGLTADKLIDPQPGAARLLKALAHRGRRRAL